MFWLTNEVEALTFIWSEQKGQQSKKNREVERNPHKTAHWKQEEKIPNGQLLESIQHHEFCPSLANFPHNTHKGPFKIYVGLGIACA